MMFRENINHVFVDSVPLVRLPETRLVDFSTVDVLLISNCFTMLALPYLMKYGFDGVIYATEPTKQLGRQLMEEFCEYIYRTPAVSHDWREESILK
jgi:integrator complex subunit 9